MRHLGTEFFPCPFFNKIAKKTKQITKLFNHAKIPYSQHDTAGRKISKDIGQKDSRNRKQQSHNKDSV